MELKVVEWKPNPWDQLEILVDIADVDQLNAYLHTLSPSETARAVSTLGSASQTRLLTILEPEEAAEIITDVTEGEAAHLIEELPPVQAAAIVDELNSDQQADLLGDLEENDAEAILQEMESEEAEDIRQLMTYSSDTAGGLMITEYLVYSSLLQVKDVLEDLREEGEQYANYDVQYAYVVSEDEELIGVLRLRDILLSKRANPVTELMIADPLKVTLDTPLEDLHDFFTEYEFFGVPVIDETGKMVGVVQRDAVKHAMNKQANDALLKVSGIVGGEEFRTMPLLTRSSRRLSWLSVNIVLNIMAASVIAFYQDTLAQVIMLAVFLPIISDMSGCSGNQAVAVSVRELTLGLIQPEEVGRVIMKEASIGMMNGLALGLLLGGAAWLWKGNPYLGLVVGGALTANTFIAVCLGGTIPLVLKRFKMDPALASGPILTTVTDMCGFLLVLSFASAMLSKLT